MLRNNAVLRNILLISNCFYYLPGMVDNMSNVRRGPRTFWASPGPEYNYNVQRAQHRSDYKSVAHPLPPPKVSFYHYVKTIRPLSYKTYVFIQ